MAANPRSDAWTASKYLWKEVRQGNRWRQVKGSQRKPKEGRRNQKKDEGKERQLWRVTFKRDAEEG